MLGQTRCRKLFIEFQQIWRHHEDNNTNFKPEIKMPFYRSEKGNKDGFFSGMYGPSTEFVGIRGRFGFITMTDQSLLFVWQQICHGRMTVCVHAPTSSATGGMNWGVGGTRWWDRLNGEC